MPIKTARPLGIRPSLPFRRALIFTLAPLLGLIGCSAVNASMGVRPLNASPALAKRLELSRIVYERIDCHTRPCPSRWWFVALPGPGMLKVQLRWGSKGKAMLALLDSPGAKPRAGVRDAMEGLAARVPIAKRGHHFVRIRIPKGARSAEIALFASFTPMGVRAPSRPSAGVCVKGQIVSLYQRRGGGTTLHIKIAHGAPRIRQGDAGVVLPVPSKGGELDLFMIARVFRPYLIALAPFGRLGKRRDVCIMPRPVP